MSHYYRIALPSGQGWDYVFCGTLGIEQNFGEVWTATYQNAHVYTSEQVAEQTLAAIKREYKLNREPIIRGEAI